MKISNNTLMVFLVAAVVISLFGTVVSVQKIGVIKYVPVEEITGYAQLDSGNVTLNVSRTASIKFISANGTVDWGSGSVDTALGFNNCTLSTSVNGQETTGCTGFNNDTGLVLENDGNLDVHVKLNISGNESIINGNAATRLFRINITENETGSCAPVADTGSYPEANYGISSNWTAGWKEMNATTHSAAPTFFCGNLSWEDSTDSLILDFNLSLPADTSGGRILFNLTATASSIEG